MCNNAANTSVNVRNIFAQTYCNCGLQTQVEALMGTGALFICKSNRWRQTVGVREGGVGGVGILFPLF